MKINDPAHFSVVIPTFEGTPFLERTLDYFRDLAFKGRLVLADNSSGEHRKFVAACAGKYPELRLEILAYPESIRFLDKMIAALEKIDSRFVLLHAHDDFLVVEVQVVNVPDVGNRLVRIAVISQEGMAELQFRKPGGLPELFEPGCKVSRRLVKLLCIKGMQAVVKVIIFRARNQRLQRLRAVLREGKLLRKADFLTECE